MYGPKTQETICGYKVSYVFDKRVKKGDEKNPVTDEKYCQALTVEMDFSATFLMKISLRLGKIS